MSMRDRYLRMAYEAEMVAQVVSLREEKTKLIEQARSWRERAEAITNVPKNPRLWSPAGGVSVLHAADFSHPADT